MRGVSPLRGKRASQDEKAAKALDVETVGKRGTQRISLDERAGKAESDESEWGESVVYLGMEWAAVILIRWKKGHHFRDENGQEMALSRDSLAGPDRSGTKSFGTFKRAV
jgi:hypothetical protein